TAVVHEALTRLIKTEKRLRLVGWAGKVNLPLDINITRKRK
ncbi:hypothetical protein NO2_1503, partial [Candidatus Termititenax persephonae]